MGPVWRPLPEDLPLPARLLTERLRTLKDAHGLSLADLAAATHYSRASWERWLNGKRLISRPALLGFAAATGVAQAPLLELLDQAALAPRGGLPQAGEPAESVETAVTAETAERAEPAEPEEPREPEASGEPEVAVVAAEGVGGRVRRRWSRRVVVAAVGGCLVLAGAAALVASQPGAGGGASTAAQGRSLSALLQGAADNRQVAVAGVLDVEQCQNLQQAAADLNQLARVRGGLVQQLARLSTDRLPQQQALVSALVDGWQASQRSDQDYARWAQASVASCARGHRPAGSSWKVDGDEASAVATAAKQRAAALWNTVAVAEGLPPITPDQL